MVSAVVLSYNRCAEVLFTISKLKAARATLPFEMEIIVVDNASIDDTTKSIQKTHPDIVLVTKEKNNGIAGWNEGFKVAKHKYLLVLDDDSCIEAGLEEAIDYLEKNTDIGILALNIVDELLLGDPLLNPEEAWQDKEDIVGFIGCGALITKKLYQQIGGFAEWIYVYTHEFDYSIRCLNAGFNIRFFSAGVVVHRTSKANRSNKRMRMYTVRNEMAIIYKYFNHRKFIYLFRILMNNLKFVKREGLVAGYYIILGALESARLWKSLNRTPVSLAIQTYYSENFWSTKPIFNNIKLFRSTNK